jgi:hypothetical protein
VDIDGLRAGTGALDDPNDKDDPEDQAEDPGEAEAAHASVGQRRAIGHDIAVVWVIAVPVVATDADSVQAAAYCAEEDPQDQETHGRPQAHWLLGRRAIGGVAVDLSTGLAHIDCRRFEGGMKEAAGCSRRQMSEDEAAWCSSLGQHDTDIYTPEHSRHRAITVSPSCAPWARVIMALCGKVD